MSTPPSASSPPRSKPPKKRSADVVSFEELLAAHKTEREPGQLPPEGVVLIGVDVELQRRMAENLVSAASLNTVPEPRLPIERLVPPAGVTKPNSGAPNFSAPRQRQVATPSAGFAPSGAPNFGAPAQDIPTPDDPTTQSNQTGLRAAHSPGRFNDDVEASELPEAQLRPDGPEFDVRDLLVRRAGAKSYTIHSVSRIQDVFTTAERDLLRWFWDRGRVLPSTESIRLVTGPNGEGARRLAAQAGLIYNTFKNLTRGLSTKLALDIVKPEKNLPTVYAIYHYSAILERQRRAGFTGVIHKNGGGRELVTATAHPAPRRPDLAVSELQYIISAPNFGAPNNAVPAPKIGALSANSGAPKFGALLRNKEIALNECTTTSSLSSPNVGAPKIVLGALFERTGQTDIDAARRITKACSEANSSVQPEEIARLIRSARIPEHIANPIGLLISTLPARCAPDSLTNYRQSWRDEDAKERRRCQREQAASLETARQILDLLAKGEVLDDETVEWAKSVVRQNSEGEAAAG